MSLKVSDLDTLYYHVNSGKIQIVKQKNGWIKVIPIDKSLGKVTVSATIRKELKNLTKKWLD